MKKSFLQLTFTCLFILAGMMSVSAQKAQCLGGGDGTASNPFRIKTVEHLDSMNMTAYGNNSNFYFQLDADIDISGYTWTPIANFKGKLDGKNHAIKNFFTATAAPNTGLFANIDGAEISNLIFNGSGTVKGQTASAVLAAKATNAVITNVVITNGITLEIDNASGVSNVGTLIGEAKDVTVTNCHSNAMFTCTGTSSVTRLGGLIGQFTNTADNKVNTIKDCSYASATPISVAFAATPVGGLIGEINNVGKTMIDNCRTDVDIIAKGGNAGGLVGKSYTSVNINNCFAKGDIDNDGTTTNAQGFGGLVGVIDIFSSGVPSPEVTITKSYATGVIGSTNAPDGQTGGLVGAIKMGSTVSTPVNIKDCYYQGSIDFNKEYVGGLIGYMDDNALLVYTINECYADATITLTAAAASAQNLYVGGLIGRSSGTIVNSYARGTLDFSAKTDAANMYAGGLIGEIKKGSVQNCFANTTILLDNTANPTNNAYLGGLAGVLQTGTSVEKCYVFDGSSIAFSNSTALPQSIGGIAGYNWGTIRNSTATGSVTMSGGGNFNNNCHGIANGTGTFTNNYAEKALFQNLSLNNQPNGMDGANLSAAQALFYVVTDYGMYGPNYLNWENFTGWAFSNPANYPTLKNVIIATPLIFATSPIISYICLNTASTTTFVLGGDPVPATQYNWTIKSPSNGTVANSNNVAWGTAIPAGQNLSEVGAYKVEIQLLDASNKPVGTKYTYNYADVKALPTAKLADKTWQFCVDPTHPITHFGQFTNYADSMIYVDFSGGEAPWDYTFNQNLAAQGPITSDYPAVGRDSAFVLPVDFTTPFTSGSNGSRNTWSLLTITDANGCVGTVNLAITDTLLLNPQSVPALSPRLAFSGLGKMNYAAATTDSFACGGTKFDEIGLEGGTDATGKLSAGPVGQWVYTFKNLTSRDMGVPALVEGDSVIATFDAKNTLGKPDSTVYMVYSEFRNYNRTNNYKACKADSFDFKLGVVPTPVIAFPTDTTVRVCAGIATAPFKFRVNNVTADSVLRFDWIYDNVFLGFPISPGAIAPDSVHSFGLNSVIKSFVPINNNYTRITDTIKVWSSFTYRHAKDIVCSLKSLANPANDSITKIAYIIEPTTTINGQIMGGNYCNQDQKVLSIQAYGADLVYEWYKNMTNDKRNTQAWEKIENNNAPNCLATASGYYMVKVKSYCGTVYSDTVQVNLGIAPVFTTNLDENGTSVCKGSSITLKVDGNANTYQWYYEGNAIAGATGSTYTISSADYEANSGKYKVVASAACQGFYTISNETKIWAAEPIPTPIAIHGLPGDGVAENGQKYNVSVGTSGYGYNDVTHYKWSYVPNGTPEPGDIYATFTATDGGPGLFTTFVKFGPTPSTGLLKADLTHVCGPNGVYTASTPVTIGYPTDIKEVTAKLVNVYPNPVSSVLNINCSAAIESVQVADLNGRVIYSQKAVGNSVLTINAEAWSKGAYLVTVVTADTREVYKVVKN